MSDRHRRCDLHASPVGITAHRFHWISLSHNTNKKEKDDINDDRDVDTDVLAVVAVVVHARTPLATSGSLACRSCQ